MQDSRGERTASEADWDSSRAETDPRESIAALLPSSRSRQQKQEVSVFCTALNWRQHGDSERVLCLAPGLGGFEHGHGLQRKELAQRSLAERWERRSKGEMTDASRPGGRSSAG